MLCFFLVLRLVVVLELLLTVSGVLLRVSIAQRAVVRQTLSSDALYRVLAVAPGLIVSIVGAVQIGSVAGGQRKGSIFLSPDTVL